MGKFYYSQAILLHMDEKTKEEQEENTLLELLAYTYLSEPEKKAYEFVYAAMAEFREHIDISRTLACIDYGKVVLAVMGDHPEIIYFTASGVQIMDLLLKKYMKVFVNGNIEVVRDKSLQLEQKVDWICRYIKDSYSDRDKQIQAAYEYVQKNVSYDYEELQYVQNSGIVKSNSHNAYGALIEGKAICKGIAGALALILKKLGFPCVVVSGKSALYGQKSEGHAWIIIKIEGQFYHMDATWDICKFQLLKDFAYDYFLLSDEDISFDHEWDMNSYPPCNSDNRNYFAVNNILISNTMQLHRVIEKFLKNKEKVIQFKVRYELSLPQNPEKYLENIIITIGNKNHVNVGLQYTWNENTRVFYAIASY